MKLNRTANEIDREARNNENENWNRLEKLSKEVDDLVLESGGDSNLEVVQARGGEPVLNDRLNKLDAELADKANKNDTMTHEQFDSWVATLLDGRPSIFFETLTALEESYPNG